ncbi:MULTISPECIES: hypothetical protein [unclassified Neorhizobium]|uniref:hypothetical protein n=1 Tax=unclassified Neorhizobium TaxID=2629175 RepID=UPI00155EC93A|nr:MULTISPECIES: hypothetical protein [unclassified Neorhizobium]
MSARSAVAYGFTEERSNSKRIGVPLYWMMNSPATWRAEDRDAVENLSWNKTPHQPTGKTSGSSVTRGMPEHFRSLGVR